MTNPNPGEGKVCGTCDTSNRAERPLIAGHDPARPVESAIPCPDDFHRCPTCWSDRPSERRWIKVNLEVSRGTLCDNSAFHKPAAKVESEVERDLTLVHADVCLCPPIGIGSACAEVRGIMRTAIAAERADAARQARVEVAGRMHAVCCMCHSESLANEDLPTAPGLTWCHYCCGWFEHRRHPYTDPRCLALRNEVAGE